MDLFLRYETASMHSSFLLYQIIDLATNQDLEVSNGDHKIKETLVPIAIQGFLSGRGYMI